LSKLNLRQNMKF